MAESEYTVTIEGDHGIDRRSNEDLETAIETSLNHYLIYAGASPDDLSDVTVEIPNVIEEPETSDDGSKKGDGRAAVRGLVHELHSRGVERL